MRGLNRSPEQISANRGRSTMANALAAACFSFVAISNVYERPSRAPAYVLLWALWMLVTTIWVFGVPGGFRLSKAERNVVNDELVRSHQAASAKFGLTIAILGLVAISLSGFFGIMLPVWSVPAMTSTTIVTTGLFFSWLQMRDD